MRINERKVWTEIVECVSTTKIRTRPYDLKVNGAPFFLSVHCFFYPCWCENQHLTLSSPQIFMSIQGFQRPSISFGRLFLSSVNNLVARTLIVNPTGIGIQSTIFWFLNMCSTTTLLRHFYFFSIFPIFSISVLKRSILAGKLRPQTNLRVWFPVYKLHFRDMFLLLGGWFREDF